MESLRIYKPKGEGYKVLMDGLDITHSCLGYEISNRGGYGAVKLELVFDEIDITELNPGVEIHATSLR